MSKTNKPPLAPRAALPTTPVWDDRRDSAASPAATAADETHPLLQSPLRSPVNDDAYDSDTFTSSGHRRIRSDYQHRRRRQRQYRGRDGGRGGLHHRRRTSLGQFFESIGNGLEGIAEDVMDAAADAKTTFAHELATPKDRYFMDMTMTRSLSLLPESIPDFVRESTEVAASFREEGEVAVPAPAVPVPLGRYVALLGAVLAVSSNGTALSLLHNVPPPLKLYWRMTATATLLFPMCIAHSIAMHNKTTTRADTTVVDPTTTMSSSDNCEATDPLLPKHDDDIITNTHNDNGNNIQHDQSNVSSAILTVLSSFVPTTLTHGQWMNFAAAVLCFTIHTLLFFAAFALTSIGNAVIFANSQALLLILGKAARGQAVLLVEGIGVLIAMAGAILCSVDTERQEKDPTTANNTYSNPLLGDLAAIGAAIAGVGYLTFAKAVRPHMSVTLFMFLVMFCGSLLVLLYLIVVGYDITFSNDPFTGLFGWMTPKQGHVFIVLHVALICNVCGTMGFVRAMQYFDNLIIAVATLLEPMIASLIAAAVGVGVLPGLQGWLGNWLVVAGTMAVLYPSLSVGGSEAAH